MTTFLIIAVLAVIFLSALIKATIGFGESLLAIPILSFFMDLQVATPLMALVAASVTLLILLGDWQGADLKATWRLLIAALFGIPLGTWGLRMLPVTWTLVGLGILLIATGSYYLFKPTVRPIHNVKWAYFAGLLAGMLGGAYNMSSPPVIVYGAARRWSPEQFRVTLQGFFLPLSGMILTSHATAGLWTQQVLQLFGFSLPVFLLAYWLGDRISAAIPRQRFEQLVYIGLIILGIMMLLR